MFLNIIIRYIVLQSERLKLYIINNIFSLQYCAICQNVWNKIKFKKCIISAYNLETRAYYVIHI